jgi:hypothetical protein
MSREGYKSTKSYRTLTPNDLGEIEAVKTLKISLKRRPVFG